jgi:hypothetical protein
MRNMFSWIPNMFTHTHTCMTHQLCHACFPNRLVQLDTESNVTYRCWFQAGNLQLTYHSPRGTNGMLSDSVCCLFAVLPYIFHARLTSTVRLTFQSHMRERLHKSSRIHTQVQTQCKHANGFRVVSGRTSAEHPHVFDLAECTISGVCFIA